jgi:hypothetical protein
MYCTCFWEMEIGGFEREYARFGVNILVRGALIASSSFGVHTAWASVSASFPFPVNPCVDSANEPVVL